MADSFAYEQESNGFSVRIKHRPSPLILVLIGFLLFQWLPFVRMSIFLVKRATGSANPGEKVSSLVLALFFVPLSLLFGGMLLRWLAMELFGSQVLTVSPQRITVKERPFKIRPDRSIEVTKISKIGLSGPSESKMHSTLLEDKTPGAKLEPHQLSAAAGGIWWLTRMMQKVGMMPSLSIVAAGKEEGIFGLERDEAQELLARMRLHLPGELFATEEEMGQIWAQRNRD